MRCAKIISPHSFGAILQLPRDQLKELVGKQAGLKAPLRDYVNKKAGNNKGRVTSLLEILSDTVPHSPKQEGILSTPVASTTTPPPQPHPSTSSSSASTSMATGMPNGPPSIHHPEPVRLGQQLTDGPGLSELARQDGLDVLSSDPQSGPPRPLTSANEEQLRNGASERTEPTDKIDPALNLHSQQQNSPASNHPPTNENNLSTNSHANDSATLDLHPQPENSPTTHNTPPNNDNNRSTNSGSNNGNNGNNGSADPTLLIPAAVG